MFATLLGALPTPPTGGLSAVIAAQEGAGLELVTDGLGPVDRDDGSWCRAAEVAAHLVKVQMIGPYTRARGASAKDAAAAADQTAVHLASLIAGGCPVVEIHEPALAGADPDGDGASFAELHRRLLAGAEGFDAHLSLAVVGGDVARGWAPLLAALPYASFGFDLWNGPDNWRVIADLPGERGVVLGVIPTAAGGDDGPELPVWAALYAASMRGRGIERVALATAGSLAHLSWDAAARKLERLGAAARIAALGSFDRAAPHLDPRARGRGTNVRGRRAARGKAGGSGGG